MIGTRRHDTYPLARKGHLRVRGDGKFGKSLGCLCLPNISALQGQREQSLLEQPQPCQCPAWTWESKVQAINPLTLSLVLRIPCAQTLPCSEVSQ